MKALGKILVIINYLIYAGLLIWIGAFPIDIANPVHNGRIQSTFVQKPFYQDNIPTTLDNPDIVYKVDNYVESLNDVMSAERHKIDKYYDVKDLVLRGLVFVPKGEGYSQIYQPIYEGASDKVMYYGAGTTHPFRYMGENHFTTIGHNMSDGYKALPSFYSAMQDYTQEIIGTKFWSTDGESIFEWIVDSSFIIRFDGGYIQDLDSQLLGAKYRSDEKPRMTLITCKVDDSYYTRRPENRIVMSGYLNGRQLIEDDYETAFKLFPELGTMRKVVGDETRKITTTSQEIDDISKSTIIKQSEKYVDTSLTQNNIIKLLFYHYISILFVWGIINIVLLVILIITSIKRKR